jgi:hypothetical protein
MRVWCDVCGESLDDEFHSTVCPHNGIGFCRRCDCVVCVCNPPATSKPANATETDCDTVPPRIGAIDQISTSREAE